MTAPTPPQNAPFSWSIICDNNFNVIGSFANPIGVILTPGNSIVGIFTPSSDYPSGAVPITASSGNAANAIATATLAASAGGRTTYITGFEVTGSGATAALAVTVTITNTITGTLSYTYVFSLGVAVANQPLIVEFSKAIPGTGPNTAIVVTCPASGAGGTNNTVVAHGYQL